MWEKINEVLAFVREIGQKSIAVHRGVEEAVLSIEGGKFDDAFLKLGEVIDCLIVLRFDVEKCLEMVKEVSKKVVSRETLALEERR